MTDGVITDEVLIQAYANSLEKYPEMLDKASLIKFFGTVGRDAVADIMKQPGFPGIQIGVKYYVSKIALLDWMIRTGRNGQYVVIPQ